MKILVVDDEQDLCEILQYNLETEGYEVTTANSAEEAMALPLQEYSLVLLDVMMGETSGFQMARSMKSNPATAGIPIIFITALEGEDNLVKGLNIGADDYIAKPLGMKEVKARVKAVIRRAAQSQSSPTLLRLLFPLKMRGMPTASRGMAKAAMLTLKPTAEIIQAVTVVPMFAPMMTPMDWPSVISPAFTKLTTITVVALDDWMSAVMRMPVSTPITRFLVIAAKMLRRRSPATFSRPSDIVFMPYRNRAREPTSENMFSIVSICI